MVEPETQEGGVAALLSRTRTVSLIRVATLLACALTAWSAVAQDTRGLYERKNAFGVFLAYSNDSSHILLGDAERRKLLEFGVVYNRRLLAGPRVNWQYSAEVMPVALESDPMTEEVVTQTSPKPATFTLKNLDPLVQCGEFREPYQETDPQGTVYSGTDLFFCRGRRWTVGQAMSPVGFQWNFRPQRQLQPYLIGHGGYLYSTKAIPTVYSGAFNFTFDFGFGVEWFQTAARSLRLDWRIHHISNHGTAFENPGIDNGVLQLTYAFGR